MATIGLSIESGAMHTVLFDAAGDAVVASTVTEVDGDVPTSLPAAVEGMRTLATGQDIEVDGVGLAYRSDDERELFAAAVQESELESVSTFSASAAFLAWLARSPEFESADRVLLYYMGPSGVTISLADGEKETLTAPKTAMLDDVTPERIGSTVPLAWEVLDEAGVKADAVALFGDSSSSRDLVDILALGLGVPVIRVGDADQVAARGAALLAAPEVAEEPEVEAPEADAPALAAVAEPVTEPTAAVASTPLVAPAPALSTAVAKAPAMAVEVSELRPRPELPLRRYFPRKKVVLAGALLAGVLSGGVALASTLPADAPPTRSSVGATTPTATGADTSLVGANRRVEVVEPAPTPELAAPPVPVDPVTRQPVVPLPSAEEWPVQEWTVDPTTGAVVPLEAPVPIPAGAIPPAAAVVPSTTVAPPEFAVPAIVPEPGKSQEQLEQEAWDRHWQHTAEWLQQEIVGN